MARSLVPIFIALFAVFLASNIAAAQFAEPETASELWPFFELIFLAVKSSQWALAGAGFSVVLTFAVKKVLIPRWDVPNYILTLTAALSGCVMGVGLAVLNGATFAASLLAVFGGTLGVTLYDAIIGSFKKKELEI